MKHFDIMHLVAFALVPVLVVLYLTKPINITKTEYKDKPVSACEKIFDMSFHSQDKTMCVISDTCTREGGKLEWFEWKWSSDDRSWEPKFWCKH